MDKEIITELMKAMNDHEISRLKFKNQEGEIELEKQVLQTCVTSPVAPTLPISVEKEVSSIPAELFIESPMVGTFYQSSKPGTPALVKVGDVVKPGQVVAIIEAMKVMNEIKSEHEGIIEKVLLQDGAPVEYGTPLFHLKK